MEPKFEVTIPGTRYRAVTRDEDYAHKLASKLAKTKTAPRRKAQPEVRKVS